jgi:hypothetical protein
MLRGGPPSADGLNADGWRLDLDEVGPAYVAEVVSVLV